VVFTTETSPIDQVSGVHRQFAMFGLGVLLPGAHEDRIASGKVVALFKQFQKADFFDLRSSYRFPATDLATYILTVDTGQQHKSVED
jgi:hypothetical protein